MKKFLLSLALAAVAAIGFTAATTGCAHVKEKSRTLHEFAHQTVVLPPGWSVASLQLTNSAAGNALSAVAIVNLSTNNPGFWASLVAPRPHVFTDYKEVWADNSSGGGTFLFTDPTASALAFGHTNQTALGGSRSTSIGQIQSQVTTNDTQAITATANGVAAGVAAALKKAATTP